MATYKKIIIGIAGFIAYIGIIFYVSADLRTLQVPQGGSGISSTSPNALIASGTTTTSALTATSSPTIGYLTATSTATSTFVGGVQVPSLQATNYIETGRILVNQFALNNLNVANQLSVNGGTINLGASPNTATTTIVANGSGQLTLSAAGTNQNIVLTPSGNGAVVFPTHVGGTAVSSTLALRSTSGVGSSDAILFQVGNNGATEAMRITNAGNVGIGTTGPGVKLVVQGVNNGNGIRLLNTAGTDVSDLYPDSGANGTFELFNSAGTSQVLLRTGGNNSYIAAGNLGIGTTSPSQVLAVNGGVYFNQGFTLGGIANGAGTAYLCTTLATGVISTSTSACNGSSLRYKDNVQDISYGLTDVLKMRPVSFNYKPELLVHGHQVGFLAEDMVGVIPEVVGFDKEGRPDSIDYAKLTSVLTRAIQDQQKEIDELKVEIKKLNKGLTLGGITSAKTKQVLGVSYTQSDYDSLKTSLITKERNGTIDASMESAQFIDMLNQECTKRPVGFNSVISGDTIAAKLANSCN